MGSLGISILQSYGLQNHGEDCCFSDVVTHTFT